MKFKDVNWKSELDDLLIAADTPEDAAATKAFLGIGDAI